MRGIYKLEERIVRFDTKSANFHFDIKCVLGNACKCLYIADPMECEDIR